jgi:hypothetical protein
MPKAKRDEVALRERWIQERLGERKYRQLRMHLSGALRLLGELAAADEHRSADATETETSKLKTHTTEAVAALAERLRKLSSRPQPIRVCELRPINTKQRRRMQRRR